MNYLLKYKNMSRKKLTDVLLSESTKIGRNDKNCRAGGTPHPVRWQNAPCALNICHFFSPSEEVTKKDSHAANST